MIQTGLIPNAHADLVTDAAYDFYGQRMATCSLDQRIKVWQLDENNSWVLEDEWKAHDAAVSKLSWAHPEFGTVLASSSFDRSVKIWEQTSSGASDPSSQSGQPAQGGSRWVERAVLSDARGTIRAVEFAPHHFGLKLATISTDNVLRVYECIEQPSLTSWALVEELDVLAVPAIPSPASLTRTHTQALATPTQTQHSHGAGSSSAPAPPGTGSGMSPSTSILTAMNEGGASASLVAQALAASQAPGSGHAQSGSGQRGIGGANREADGGWCLSWCKDRYWGEVVAAGSGTNGVIKVIQINARRSATLLALPSTASTATGVPRPTASHSAMNESTPAPNTTATATVGLPTGDNTAADAHPSATDDSGATSSSAPAAATDDSGATATDGPGGAGSGTGTSASTTGAPTAPDVLAFPGRAPGKPASAAASTNAITSVAWAPSCGRSYHLIATGGRDGRVRVWKVRPGEELGGGDVSMGMGEPDDADTEERWSATVVADFEHHRSAVTRVEWNVTGTILASAGNDGRVRLWKATARNVWRPAGSVGVEQAESEAPQTQTDSAGREGGLNGNGVDMDTA